MAKGGVRPGAGRPSKHDEDRVRDVALRAILKVHGTEEKAFEFLLQHEEPTLIRFAYEHAFGKPKERQDVAMTFPDIEVEWPDED